METIIDSEPNSEGLDIFLFNNGQEYTPPRKYHLNHDDLHWWDTTLKYLARSQYGSLHSVIELYTINGVKIHDPTEICCGTAYVAVAPPNPFIDSGYDHYLIKASRSWEKSQMRKLNNQPDETTVANGAIKTEVLKSSRPARTSLDNTADKATPRRPSMKNGANSKQIVKKKLTGQVRQQEHSSILRKSNSNTHTPTPQSMSAKTTPIKRRQIANKYSKIPKRIDNKMVTPEKNKITSQAPVMNTVPETRTEVVGTKANAGNTSLIKTWANNIPQKHEIKDQFLKPLTEDTDVIVISNLYKNMESDIMSTLLDDNSENQADAKDTKGNYTGTVGSSLVVLKTGLSFQNPNSIDETNGTMKVAPEATTEIATQKTNSTQVFSGVVPNTATGNFSPIETTERVTSFTYQNISLPTHQFPEGVPQNISFNVNRKESHFMALANKGDVVNLNVNIEIRNPEVAVQAKPNVDTCKSRSLTEEKVDYNGTVTQSKSVQSLLNDYFPRLCCQDDQNLVYIQCACIDDSFRSDLKALCPEVRTCFVLLPLLARAGKERCKCENNERLKTSTKPVKTSADIQQPKVNINNSVKDSGIFIQTDQQESCANTVPGTSETECVVDCISKCHVEVCTECGGKKMSVSQTSTSRTTMLSEKKIDTLSYQQNKKTTLDMCEMGSQTDWCSTMLEARVNSDGRYTFHLPSIQTIKQYDNY